MKELDFEELDQVMDDMKDSDNITKSIAADVAKIEEIKKVSDKPKPVKPAVTTKKPAAKKTTAPKKKPAEKPKSKKSDEGERVFVKVLTKPPEPEVITFQPNPKTGKFMDLVSPLSDMSIQGERPKLDAATEELPAAEEFVIENAPVDEPVDNEPVAEELTMEEEPTVEVVSVSEVEVRERLNNAGLDPDATLEELDESFEEPETDETEDEVLDSIMKDLEDEPEAEVSEVAEAAEELEQLADILDIPDHSEAFLSDVEIEKRPLGGEETAVEMGALAVEEAKDIAPITEEEKTDPATEKEILADEEFIKDELKTDIVKEPAPEKKPEKTKPEKPAKAPKPPKPSKPPKPVRMSGEPRKGTKVILYILLVILFIILGGSLGALAYFSGLF
ncbi:MAG: hypothetical protein LBL08_03490 [Candidatus Nomurabacteria bacterium]|jgi:hypothetical protein|nr:hypothetical protein [Candidatus Nomurabacteria bacterium]